MGAACALVALSFMYGRLQLLLRASLVIVPLFAVMWTFLPKQDQEYAASFDRQKYDNIDVRYDNFEKTVLLIKSSPFIGHGISIRKQLDATNLVFTTLAESGIFGFVLFVTAGNSSINFLNKSILIIFASESDKAVIKLPP